MSSYRSINDYNSIATLTDSDQLLAYDASAQSRKKASMQAIADYIGTKTDLFDNEYLSANFEDLPASFTLDDNDLLAVRDISTTTLRQSTVGDFVSYLANNATISVTATNTTASRNLQNRFADTYSVKDFGVVGDGTTDDLTAIQAAEDALTALYGSTGSEVDLVFPQGDYVITESIQKKAGVRWIGAGKIRRSDNSAPTGASFSLVTCSNVDNWSIDGVQFENCSHGFVSDASITQDTDFGDLNNCIDIEDCNDFYITQCRFNKYSVGVRVTDCEFYRIINNQYKADNAKTLASMIDLSYTTYNLRQNTGAIVIGGSRNSETPTIREASNNFIIAQNIIDNVGLDIGIHAISAFYDEAVSNITQNFIVGGHCGIQMYRGDITELNSNAPTYAGNMNAHDNIIRYTWEQGIYQRGVIGCSIQGNKIIRSGMGGVSSISACAITLRINPFDDDATVQSTFLSAAADNVKNDYASIVKNNTIINHGTASGTCDPNILIELDHVLCEGNTIVRSAEFSTAKTGRAIYGANGKNLKTMNVSNNAIIGNFTQAIEISDILKIATMQDSVKCDDNYIKGDSDNGILMNFYSFNGSVQRNTIIGNFANNFIDYRRTPYSIISKNKMIGNSTNGVVISQGCLASDMAYYLTGGTVTNNNRRGGTLEVTENRITGIVTNPYTQSNTTTDDALIWGRCKVYKDNYYNDERVDLEFSGGTPQTTFNARTWMKHDFIPNSSIAVGQPAGKYCITAGGYGSATITTGDVTNASNVITNVASLDGYGIGLYIEPASGYTAPTLIIDIDTDNDTITVADNSSATATGVNLSVPAPTFAATANLV